MKAGEGTVKAQISAGYEIYRADTKKAVELDGIMVLNSGKSHARRAEFYDGIDERTMQEKIKKFIPVKVSDVLIECAKDIFYQLGVYCIAKKVLKG